jgi:uncharacterized membrane protein YbhN (UPF0104 family)
MARSAERKPAKKPSGTNASSLPSDGPLWKLEGRHAKVISRKRFVARMGLAAAAWGVLMLIALAIGMAGYSYFESLVPIDGFVNTAMVLSGMGPVEDSKTFGGKIFAGTFAVFSGFIIIIGAGVILVPIFHRVLHRFHMEESAEG